MVFGSFLGPTFYLWILSLYSLVFQFRCSQDSYITHCNGRLGWVESATLDLFFSLQALACLSIHTIYNSTNENVSESASPCLA